MGEERSLAGSGKQEGNLGHILAHLVSDSWQKLQMK